MATAIKESKKNDDIVLIDAGRIFPTQGKYVGSRGRLALDVMEKMGYDAIALGPLDIVKGFPVLESLNKKRPDFPIVISNLVSTHTQRPPFGKRYLVVSRKGKKIGIVAVVPDRELEKEIADAGIGKRGLRVLPPEDALKEIMGKLRAKVNMVVLISQLTRKETFSLVDRVKGIDMVFLGLPERVMGLSVPPKLTTKFVWVAPKGDILRKVKVSFDKKGHMDLLQMVSIRLDRSVVQDKTVASLVKRKLAAWEEADRKEMQAWRKKILSMTPEEYVQYLQKHGYKPPLPPSYQKSTQKKGCGK